MFALGESSTSVPGYRFCSVSQHFQGSEKGIVAMRENIDDTSSRFLLEAKIASSNGVEIKQPRIYSKQAHRANQGDVEGVCVHTLSGCHHLFNAAMVLDTL